MSGLAGEAVDLLLLLRHNGVQLIKRRLKMRDADFQFGDFFAQKPQSPLWSASAGIRFIFRNTGFFDGLPSSTHRPVPA